jgi:hypothetical protein
MSCERVQERMAGLVVGAAGRRERLDIEAHSRSCARCAEALGDLATASIALERAYAPLRSATVALSPARVRLAMRVPQPTPAGIRITRVTSRLTEVALAAAVTAFAFVGSASVVPMPAIVEETSSETVAPSRVNSVFDEENFIRWIRIGHHAASSDLVDPAVAPRHADEDVATMPHERVGLAR